MRNPFTNDPTHPDYNNNRQSAYDLVPVVPSDTEGFGFTALGFYVQPGKQVTFVAASGETRTIPVVGDNFTMDVGCTQIMETGSIRGGSGAIDNPSHPEYKPWIWVKKPYQDS